ncbi:MAG: translation elongation factor Ts [Buchnera aphidicola (Schlechtendalia peitan)]
MNKITTFLVKNLRSKTGAGIVDCKRALIETQGDIEKSIDFLRQIGKIKALQKKSAITFNGAIFIGTNNKFSVMLELNCETDFVSKEDCFVSFGKDIINYSVSLEKYDIVLIQKFFEEQKIDLITRINENIILRRIKMLSGDNISSYLHNNRIGVLLKTTEHVDKIFIKNLAMHIAASKPEYLRPDLIPNSVIEREYNIQLELAIKSKKSEDIIERIVKGRMIKFANENSLLGQNFIFNLQRTVGDVIKEKNIDIIEFSRFEVGELISNVIC